MNSPKSESPSAADDHIPDQGRLLGIDYGTVRVGVAVSDTLQSLASPLHNYQRVSRPADELFFQKQVQDYEVVGIVVGLPLHMHGDESEKSREARRYGKWLKSITGVPVTWQDERLSSAQAETLLHAADLTQRQRQGKVDKLAARIILQAWMDGRRKRAAAESTGEDEDQDA